MKKIQPSVSSQEMLCVDVTAPPSGLIVFGASGDLTKRKLISSLYQLFCDNLLTEKFYLIGCGRKKLSDEQFRSVAKEAIQNSGKQNTERMKAFLKRCYFVSGDYSDPEFYQLLQQTIGRLDEHYEVACSHVFYLSIPPALYETVAENLGKAGLSKKFLPSCSMLPRLVIEKPFGRDLKSAIQLNEKIRTYFDESQIYRIDHYLGKETVQNILMFRFANAIFEPIWNRNYIDHIQITIAESLGVEHRGGYYDQSGAIRDMFQNHLLGMLALVAMEPPTSFDADAIRDEKVKLLKSIRPIKMQAWEEEILRGQYTAGTIDDNPVPAYLDEPNIASESKTDTYVASRLFVDNWRWRGVPFYLRTGKRLSKRVTEIAIQFKAVPHSMFDASGIDELPPNVLVLKIQPQEGIRLSFQAKRPGSKVCMSTLAMNFNYSDVFGRSAPEAYQRLLLDCMVGDQTLFMRQDDVEISWELITPVLEAWAKADMAPCPYSAGVESFTEADQLLEKDGRQWRKLSEM